MAPDWSFSLPRVEQETFSSCQSCSDSGGKEAVAGEDWQEDDQLWTVEVVVPPATHPSRRPDLKGALEGKQGRASRRRGSRGRPRVGG